MLAEHYRAEAKTPTDYIDNNWSAENGEVVVSVLICRPEDFLPTAKH
ncbi:MAG: hypothetical protein ACJAVI_005954 [Candidatus Azotimanducaceae bacterium]|jgi:hypothetical protein